MAYKALKQKSTDFLYNYSQITAKLYDKTVFNNGAVVDNSDLVEVDVEVPNHKFFYKDYTMLRFHAVESCANTNRCVEEFEATIPMDEDIKKYQQVVLKSLSNPGWEEHDGLYLMEMLAKLVVIYQNTGDAPKELEPLGFDTIKYCKSAIYNKYITDIKERAHIEFYNNLFNKKNN